MSVVAATLKIKDWPSIVGEDIASYTAPERLKWPRGVDAFGDIEPGNEHRPGATLVIRVDGPRAIELQHRAHQIIERINTSFGYRAVSELFFSSRRRHTRLTCDWSSDVCSSDLSLAATAGADKSADSSSWRAISLSSFASRFTSCPSKRAFPRGRRTADPPRGWRKVARDRKSVV